MAAGIAFALTYACLSRSDKKVSAAVGVISRPLTVITSVWTPLMMASTTAGRYRIYPPAMAHGGSVAHPSSSRQWMDTTLNAWGLT